MSSPKNPPPPPSTEALNAEVLQTSARRTRRSFVVAAAAATAGYGLYRALNRAPIDQGIPRPLRRAFNLNAEVARATFEERGLTPTFPPDRAVPLRTNGDFGLKNLIAPEHYRIQVTGLANPRRFPQYTPDVTAWDYHFEAGKTDEPGVEASTKEAPKAAEDALDALQQQENGRRERGQEEAGQSDSTLDPGTPGLLLTLADLETLPRHELVTEFKCIEGWSQIAHWAGYRLADFVAAYPPAPKPDGSLPRYVYMETPDGDYYCGYDLRVCQHPQSLLVTEMAGQPLTQFHGAPLRLHMPIKYGYKQIKRIGLIAYTDDQPDDYWTKLGYDWYAGL